MTPAINRPHSTSLHPAIRSGAARSGRPLNTTRPLSAATTRFEDPSHPGLGRVDPHPTLARRDDDYVGIPYCERCGTDEFVYLETFVPAKHHRDGSVSQLAEVTYFCSGCEDFSAHAVPASWVPPGWYLG